MNEYYFTFGQNHSTLDGFNLKDYYVKVIADDYSEARILFCEKFALPVMGKEDKWSFQYEKDEFKFSYFPKGEFATLK